MRSLIGNRRWRLKEASCERAEHILKELGCSRAFARVLAARTGGDPKKLLSSELSALHLPAALLGIPQALERIEQALKRSEKIFIHGDFDVDGLTSAALLYLGLKRLGFKELKVEIEDRERGHGLNPEVVRRVIAEKFKVLITSDCGVSDFECVTHLQQSGVDVIITDHHHVPERLPPALSIINPKQKGCAYPNKDIAAVGVVFQLLRALHEHLGVPVEEVYKFLDLVMLGTVADLVPLARNGQIENKILVAQGLKLLAEGKGSLGLRILIEKLALDPKSLTAGELSYILVPKLNAANRVGDPRVAFLLLTTQDKKRAEYLSEILLDYNDDRQTAQDDLRYQAEELIRNGGVDLTKDKMIILEGRYWNPGIIGLVASDLVEKYYLPVVLVSVGDQESRASGRSIYEFDLIGSLEAHRELFIKYGGHQMAAGFSIKNENLPLLKRRLSEYARRQLADLEGPTSTIDAILEPREITLDLCEEIQQLAPFGMGNPEPRFLLKNVQIVEAQTVGNGGKHLKLKVSADGVILNCIGFDFGDYVSEIYSAGEVDMVGKLRKDTWRERERLQLELEDVLKENAVG